MNKTDIEWCDYTFNPVTGCLHGCGYCYARKIAHRFGGYTIAGGYTRYTPLPDETYVLDEPHLVVRENDKVYKAPYPYRFMPTFHRYRLAEPQKVKKPSKIFVCSMADLFGDWVPDEWIDEVFEACKKAPQHKYLFLTKNPKRYDNVISGYMPKNWWFGATVTKPEESVNWSIHHGENTFISIEPLLGSFKGKKITGYDWVIIGQQTGPGAKPPNVEWVESLINLCRDADVPIFIKSPLYEKFPIQEWPEGKFK